ncbi:basic amino acid ABC transporter substrate-binding protein [Haloplanus natans]|uniref:basic amino acid ABC transporter substrate-binding protein n=1 Tax=Haloplanus natans TaxID=376171 RepID=UPI000678196D|nr:basic amino acid ABC transporter substrate-binding protein [Haloplanus natans]
MSDEPNIDRRAYLTTVGVGGLAALAGCAGSGADTSGSESDTDEAGTETGSGMESGSTLPDSVDIGSDIPYRPFEYKTTDGELKGFDVSIAQAVFEDQLGITPNFTDTSFDTIISSLNNGNFRVVMSAMTINETRDQQVDFSDPYFTAYQTILVLKDSDITARTDLKGKTVGVQKGTTGANAAEELKSEFGGDLAIKRYDQIPAAFDALINNQVVAVINDNTVNGEFADQNDAVRFVEGEGAAADAGKNAPPYLTLTIEEYGIAFRQDDDEFRQRVNEALAAIREDGTYDEIYGQYFSG